MLLCDDCHGISVGTLARANRSFPLVVHGRFGPQVSPHDLSQWGEPWSIYTGGMTPKVMRLSEAASRRLDAVRAASAFLVLLSHWRMFTFTPHEVLSGHVSLGKQIFYFFTAGVIAHRAVLVFFLLSGFLVGGSVLRSIDTGTWSWKTYSENRLSRLYVVLLPGLLAVMLWDYGSVHIQGGFAAATAASASFEPRGWHAFLVNATFLQNIFRGPYGTDKALWSLSCEFWYYAAFPFLALALFQKTTPVRRALWLLIFIAICVFMNAGNCLLGITWMLGAGIHFLPSPKGGRWRKLGVLVSFFGLVVMISDHHLSSVVAILIFSLIGMAFLYLLIIVPPPKRSFSGTRWLAKRGSEVSYSMYVLHMPAIVFFVALLHRPRGGFQGHELIGALGILLIVLLYVLVMYLCFERNTVWVRQQIHTQSEAWLTQGDPRKRT